MPFIKYFLQYLLDNGEGENERFLYQDFESVFVGWFTSWGVLEVIPLSSFSSKIGVPPFIPPRNAWQIIKGTFRGLPGTQRTIGRGLISPVENIYKDLEPFLTLRLFLKTFMEHFFCIFKNFTKFVKVLFAWAFF